MSTHATFFSLLRLLSTFAWHMARLDPADGGVGDAPPPTGRVDVQRYGRRARDTRPSLKETVGRGFSVGSPVLRRAATSRGASLLELSTGRYTLRPPSAAETPRPLAEGKGKKGTAFHYTATFAHRRGPAVRLFAKGRRFWL